MTETFLDGRVKARQPETGFRSGTDAVLLAAAVPARAGQSALELGAGAGAASLCLAARVPGLDLTGVEVDPALAALAEANAAASDLPTHFVAADVFALPPSLRREYDQVFANPPFHGEGNAPSDAARARALMDDGSLPQWLSIGLQRTVSGGFFTAIIRADRLGEALAALPPRGVNILPLWPRAGMAAKRAVLQARKGSRAPVGLLPGLALHDAEGRYTAEAEAILRHGASLALDSARL
ncbi:MAG: methyltransferase [Alphaproteobacteria bacterium]|nr:methyltransferase [Alphaproteobacteria bacterium]